MKNNGLSKISQISNKKIYDESVSLSANINLLKFYNNIKQRYLKDKEREKEKEKDRQIEQEIEKLKKIKIRIDANQKTIQAKIKNIQIRY